MFCASGLQGLSSGSKQRRFSCSHLQKVSRLATEPKKAKLSACRGYVAIFGKEIVKYDECPQALCDHFSADDLPEAFQKM